MSADSTTTSAGWKGWKIGLRLVTGRLGRVARKLRIEYPGAIYQGKASIAMRLRHESEVTVGWIAQRLRMVPPGHVNHLLYRARQRGHLAQHYRRHFPALLEIPVEGNFPFLEAGRLGAETGVEFMDYKDKLSLALRNWC